MIKSNHEILNMVIQLGSTVGTTMNINYCNTNIRHQKTFVGNLGTRKLMLETR